MEARKSWVFHMTLGEVSERTLMHVSDMHV